MLDLRTPITTKLALAIGTILASSAIDAAVITVTNTANTGDGSLRWAVEQANSNADPDNVIIFDAAVNGQTIVLDSRLQVTKTLLITGNGMDETVIDANGGESVFEIYNSADRVELQQLSLTGGGSFSGFGGAINTYSRELVLQHVRITNSTSYQGGAIHHAPLQPGSLLEINNSEISGNTVPGMTTASSGGGIHAMLYGDNSQIRIASSQIRSNCAYVGGGLSVETGGMLPIVGQSTIIEYSEINNNICAAWGGGVRVSAAGAHLLSIMTSSIEGNSAYFGGGIHANGGVFVNYSLISGNVATEAGGGAYLLLSDVPPTSNGLVFNHSTISGNVAHGQAAGIMLASTYSAQAPFDLALRHSTIAFNRSDAETPWQPYGSGVSNLTPWALEVDHSIVTNNRVWPLFVPGVDYGLRDLDGSFDARWSLLGFRSPTTTVIEGDGVQNVISAALWGLADNGGLTRTHKLQPDSPARDAGDPNYEPPPGLDLDQRFDANFVRVFNGRVDIGAFESQIDMVFASSFDNHQQD